METLDSLKRKERAELIKKQKEEKRVALELESDTLDTLGSIDRSIWDVGNKIENADTNVKGGIDDLYTPLNEISQNIADMKEIFEDRVEANEETISGIVQMIKELKNQSISMEEVFDDNLEVNEDIIVNILKMIERLRTQSMTMAIGRDDMVELLRQQLFQIEKGAITREKTEKEQNENLIKAIKELKLIPKEVLAPKKVSTTTVPMEFPAPKEKKENQYLKFLSEYYRKEKEAGKTPKRSEAVQAYREMKRIEREKEEEEERIEKEKEEEEKRMEKEREEYIKRKRIR